MNGEEKPGNKIDRIIVGEPIAAGDRLLSPVARVAGWLGAQKGERGNGFGGLLRIQPLEARVSGPGGDESSVYVTDPVGDAERQMVLSALFVAAVSVLLLLIALLRPRA